MSNTDYITKLIVVKRPFSFVDASIVPGTICQLSGRSSPGPPPVPGPSATTASPHSCQPLPGAPRYRPAAAVVPGPPQHVPRAPRGTESPRWQGPDGANGAASHPCGKIAGKGSKEISKKPYETQEWFRCQQEIRLPNPKLWVVLMWYYCNSCIIPFPLQQGSTTAASTEKPGHELPATMEAGHSLGSEPLYQLVTIRIYILYIYSHYFDIAITQYLYRLCHPTHP